MGGAAPEIACDLHDIAQFLEEPTVDLGQAVDLTDAVSGLHRLADCEYPHIRRGPQCLVQVSQRQLIILHESVHSLPDHAQAFLDGLLEGASDGHHLSDRFHAGTDFPVYAMEFAQIPAGNLADNVVQRRFEESGCRLGDTVFQFEQAFSQPQFGRDEGERIAGGLGSQGGRTAQTRVDLDHAIVFRVGIEGILNVAFTYDAQVADDGDGAFAQEMVFTVGQGLGRSDDDTLAGVDAERVEVLHIADRDAVVIAVANDLIFDFLPAFQAFFDEDLGRKGERFLGQGTELRLIVAEAGAKAAEGIGRTQDDGIAEPSSRRTGRFHALARFAADGAYADLIQTLDKALTVFGVDDGLHGCSEHLDAIPVENTAFIQGNPAVEGSLSSE